MTKLTSKMKHFIIQSNKNVLCFETFKIPRLFGNSAGNFQGHKKTCQVGDLLVWQSQSLARRPILQTLGEGLFFFNLQLLYFALATICFLTVPVCHCCVLEIALDREALGSVLGPSIHFFQENILFENLFGVSEPI